MKLSVQVFALTAACLVGRHGGARDASEDLRVPATARAVAHAVTWTTLRPGVELGEVALSAPNEGRRTRVILLRYDPSDVRLDLVTRIRADYRGGDWTIAHASMDAIAAFNAGQFTGIAPWGWSVVNGRERRAPGTGPLSMAVVEDSSGQLHFVPADSIAAMRARAGIRSALQSYPMLLDEDGRIPEPITTPGLGVDVPHRDARLALAQLNDGRILVLFTRFGALGEAGAAIPFGITLHETASLLQALGARRAVALDGGISAQMLVRDGAGATRSWPGWRRVPVGIELHHR
ncbi:MAG TPA: phosphodiester glycosidase family protein [Gemmatimonadales bacterium]|nr:phosphodiester glycosidase family protein [Gemmatimonadales bacterium]